MIKKIRTPHDPYFQSMMEKVEVASSFFQSYTSSEVVQAIDWSTLAIADSVRRAPNRKPLYTDITYHALTKAPQGHVYLHVEHERSIDKFMLERMLEYNVRLMRKHRNQGHDKLPLMINYLLYNGLAEDYPHFETIYNYFDRPDLAKLVMGMSFILANLNKQSEEALLTHGAASMMEVLLKRASRAKFPRRAKEHQHVMRKLPAAAYLNAGLDYALDVGKDKAEEIIDAFVSIYPELKETIMTAAQQLRKEGMQQGIRKEKMEIAKSMLAELYLDMSTVAKITGLPKEELEKIQASLKSVKE
jgi:predicted transposase YdaD